MTESSLPARPRPAVQSRLGTLAVLALTIGAVAGVAYLSAPRTTSESGGVTSVSVPAGPGEGPRIGAAAPAFVAADADGASVSLAALKGRPVWLTFGASWCQSCRAENPDIEAAWRKHGTSGLAVVAVFLSDDAAAVRDYGARVSLSYTKVPDPQAQLASSYRIVGLPSHFFIDRNGILHHLRIGSLSPAAMDAELQEIGG